MPDNPQSVLVVGGGWAGLACAVRMAEQGHAVTVLESAKQTGGRARRVAFAERPVDNGQHLLLGAYHQTLALLEQLGVSTESSLLRCELDLYLQQLEDRPFRLHLPHLLSPVNLFLGLLRAEGFNLLDRWRALQFGLRLFANTLAPEHDLSVAELLRKYRQTANNIRALWEPICLAALNTPIDEASAQIFIRVLHDSFCRSHLDADMLLPRVDLGRLLPDAASDYVEQHGGFVHLSQRVNELTIVQGQIKAVKTDVRKYEAEHVVLAIPPHACVPLLKAHAELHDIAYNLKGFSYYPIYTVYLQYPPSVQADRPIQGLLGTTTQWLVDRRICGQAGLIAAVISGPGEHTGLDNDSLSARVQTELQQMYPHWPAAQDVMVIREKRATFNCRAGISTLRPGNRTPVSGLWLAGDYTDTGYPATIESAVISGLAAANNIHQEAVTT